ncbi:MAG TPA: putative baseplate assembly protein [Kofleriaceae bacterium]|nr:putative baseplate assembly protein [Kofleriaceae bacterium]
MSHAGCSCTKQPCGCCEGVAPLTPAAIYNRPGLDALSYRVGTHARFFETMQARLSTVSVDAVGPDGQTVQTSRPLQGLTARDRGDLSIALLDSWATVADVLTFYQERIANEGFLRTATERRSVLELARLVGYALRPGVAATVYLAYTVDEKQAEPVTIPAGARSQSMPGPGETPQSFETSEDLIARGAWNNLLVRLHRPQSVTLAIPLEITDDALSVDALYGEMQARRHAQTVDTIVVAGTSTNLRPGDKLLLLFREDGTDTVVRTVASLDTQLADQRTAIALQPIDRTVVACAALLASTLAQLPPIDADPGGEKKRVVNVMRSLLEQTYLDLPGDPAEWIDRIITRADLGRSFTWKPFDELRQRIEKVTTSDGGKGGVPVTEPEAFVPELLKPRVPQAANSLRLTRALGASFALRSDASPQLLVQFAPVLRDSFYRALAGANVNSTAPSLKNVYALRTRTALFGAGASKLPAYYTDESLKGLLKPPSLWNDDWYYADFDETNHNAFLDQANDAIAPGSYVLAHVSHAERPRQVLQVAEASVSPRSEYGLSGPSTQLVFKGAPWRDVGSESTPRKITDLRRTQMYAQSEPLALVDEPITDTVGGQQIELGALYSELQSGRWVIVSGERADIPGVSGVRAAELMMVSGLHHGFDPDLPGDQTHTTLILATPLAYRYKRETLTIHGNVAKATHGETRNEILGSGDGARPLQSFTLKQPPLTFVPAPTAAGAESTLRVYVDNVEWKEADSLAGLGPRDRRFITATDDAGTTQLTFGNGVAGARLPTGVQNVKAAYRSGIGTGGNVKAEQVSLLQTRPLGVTGVINPLRASGGADKESRDLARDNVPLSVMPLDRLVSVVDYADFARGFAGIAEATARRTSDGRRQLLHLTIAGVDDAPIDPTSDLYRNLLAAFRKLGDPDLPVQVDLRELTTLVLSAGVKLLPDYLWEPVATAIRTRLLDAFGFGKRALGQPALRCEVSSAIQGVPGVAYVDIDAFGGVTEKVEKPDPQGRRVRVLRSPDDISKAVRQIVHPSVDHCLGGDAPTGERVDAFPGGSDGGVIRPAELVIFTPAVPDTLILNQLT